MSRPRLIRKFVGLFIQSNNRVLLPRLPFQDAFLHAQNLSGDTTKNPKENIDLFERPSETTIFINKEGEIDSFRGTKDKRKIQHIQKVKTRIINKNGRSHKWNFIFPDKLYLEFINIKNPETLQEFVEKSEFCIFPTLRESKELLLEYKKANLEIPPEFVVVQNKNLTREIRIREEEIIFQTNLKYIWKKKIEFEDMVKKYANGSLEYHKLLWINKNMENVSDSFFNAKHFSLDEIFKGIKGISAKDKREIGEAIGLDLILKLPIVPAYRVYGHYALCCLEFYLDIMKKNKLMICKNCGQINRIEFSQHSDREYCLLSENLICAREMVAKNKSKQRKK